MMHVLFSFLVGTAHAQGFILDLIGSVSWGLPTFGSGSGAIAFMAQSLVNQFRPLLFFVGLLALTIFGFRMVIGQEDESIDKAKTAVIAVISGLMVAVLIENFIAAFYGYTGGEEAPPVGPGIVNLQILGILNWALSIAGVLAVTMIIVSGLKAVTSPTNEEGITNLRSTITSVVIGMLVLGFRIVIAIAVGATGAPSPNLIIAMIANILTFVLGFVAIAAVIVLVYAGILMVTNYGREEEVTKAKGIIQRAILGIIILLLSIGIVQFVVGVV